MPDPTIKRFFFDLETTGVDLNIHAIHQLAYIIDLDGTPIVERNFKLRPWTGCKVNLQALEICGVTIEQLRDYPDDRIAFEALRKDLDSHINKFDKTDKMFLCGFNNVAFDNQFLRTFWERYDKYFFSYFWPSGLDAMVLALQDLRHTRTQLPNFTLKTVSEAYDVIPAGDWHDALTDVQVTRDLYYKITAPAYERAFLFREELSPVLENEGA